MEIVLALVLQLSTISGLLIYSATLYSVTKKNKHV